MSNIFRGLFDSDLTQVIRLSDFLLCLAVALALGFVIALAYMLRSRYTKSFVTTLVLLPAVVCVVIMMVNGNVGAGVAVAGAFSLVRFRSVPGTAREICALFFAMAAGLMAGMGYLAYAGIFTLVLCLAFVLLSFVDLGSQRNAARYKTLTVTVPEDLSYPDAFTDIFAQYTKSWELVRVKTTNMGSLLRLSYQITLADCAREKEMLDQLRCRNGNLEISLASQEMGAAEL